MARTKNRQTPRHDEKLPLSFDARKQQFYRDHYQRSILDLDDPQLGGLNQDGAAFRSSRPIHDMLVLIRELVHLHEMTWRPSTKNERLVYFPFMFVVPQRDWQLRNMATQDVYTVKKVSFDKEQNFTGGVFLKGGLKAPGKGLVEDPSRWDRLEWVDPDGKTIEFHTSWPEREAVENPAASSEADEAARTPLVMGPTVTVLLVDEQPGSIDKKAFGDKKMWKPRHYGYEQDPFDPINYQLAMHWQWFETILQFDCWSPLNREADRLIDWFRNFMNLYTWVIKLNGVSEVRFSKRRGDLTTQSFRDALPGRSLQYYFRTLNVQPVRVRNLSRVHVQMKVHEGFSPITEEPELTGGGLWENEWDRFHDDSGNWVGGSLGITDTRDFADSFLNP